MERLHGGACARGWVTGLGGLVVVFLTDHVSCVGCQNVCLPKWTSRFAGFVAFTILRFVHTPALAIHAARSCSLYTRPVRCMDNDLRTHANHIGR
eukprot:5871603-Prymnesium_polylepis.1